MQSSQERLFGIRQRHQQWLDGGKEYEIDCIIYATGFEVASDFASRAGFDLRGVGGQTLAEKWRDGLATFHGLHTRQFPNMFFIS